MQRSYNLKSLILFIHFSTPQDLQRVVDAIILAPHVSNVNRRQGIPLGNSDTRRAMYAICIIEFFNSSARYELGLRWTCSFVMSVESCTSFLYVTQFSLENNYFFIMVCSVSGRCPPAAYVDQNLNSMLAFEDRTGWNVYQYCLKRRKIIVNEN